MFKHLKQSHDHLQSTEQKHKRMIVLSLNVQVWLVGAKFMLQILLTTTYDILFSVHVREYSMTKILLPLESILFIEILAGTQPGEIQGTNPVVILCGTICGCTSSCLQRRNILFIFPLPKKPIWAFELYLAARQTMGSLPAVSKIIHTHQG